MRKELKILLFSESLFFLAGGLFGPLYAVFVERIGGDLLTAGSAYGVFSIVAGFSTYFISKWENRKRHQEKFVVISYLLSFFGYLAYSFISAPVHLFMVQILFGLAGAIGAPAYNGLFSKNLDKGKYLSEWGVYDASYYTVVGISAIVGGFIANTYGFDLLFIIMTITSFICVIVALLLVFPDNIYSKKKKKR